MSVSVHYPRSLSPALRSQLEIRLEPGVKLSWGPDLPDPSDYQILVAGRPTREELTASERLQALIIPWAGLPESTRSLMREFPQIAVHNLHHNARPVAEMALTLLLAAAKNLLPADRALRAHDWRPRYRPTPALLLEGRTALVLGYGAVGQRVAALCRGLGMRVIGVRRREGKAVGNGSPADELFPIDTLKKVLPRAQVLMLCLPHTPETEGLIGADELALLPPEAIVVNIGRGPVLEPGALYQALKEGQIFAAGLDVWYNYPTDEASRAETAPSAYPFHQLENLVMSPHRAGHSDQTEALRLEKLAELLNAAARGEAVPNRVDLEAGY